MTTETYTYQGGRKLLLSRVTTHFISRAKKHTLLADRFEPIDSITPHAWLVRTSDATIDDDIRRARRHAAAYPVYLAEDGSKFLLTDRIFVRFWRGSDATDADVNEFARKYQLRIVERLSERDLLFEVDASQDVIDVVCQLTERASEIVEIVDHDLNIDPEPASLVLNGPFCPMQWYFLSSAPPRDPLISPVALVDCEGAWRSTGLGSSEIVISVIDSGCNLNDPNFANGKFAGWGALIDGRVRSDATLTEMDSSKPHGTLCATLAAASANDIGGVGAAPNCRLLPVKWDQLDGQAISYSSFGSIIKFIRDKADVVSCSWSIGPHGYWPKPIVDALRDAAANGGPRGRGIVWSWSAGNGNYPIHFSSDIPVPVDVRHAGMRRVVAQATTQFTNSFVGIPGVLHVGAISSTGQRCHYSNYGTGLDLVAPSANSHTYGRYPVPGVQVMAPRNLGLEPIGGTSAAAPIVAGVAALVLSANPTLTAVEVASILCQTADKNLVMRPYKASGVPGDEPDAHWDVSPIPPFNHGRFVPIHHPDGTWSGWFGFGKVNALRAVTEAQRRAAIQEP